MQSWQRGEGLPTEATLLRFKLQGKAHVASLHLQGMRASPAPAGLAKMVVPTGQQVALRPASALSSPQELSPLLWAPNPQGSPSLC